MKKTNLNEQICEGKIYTRPAVRFIDVTSRNGIMEVSANTGTVPGFEPGQSDPDPDEGARFNRFFGE